MTQGVASGYGCPRCGTYLVYGQLACPRCGALVYADRLRQLSAAAQRLEPTDPVAAAVTWRQCLDLLPPDSAQYHAILARLQGLQATTSVAPVIDYEPAAAQRRPDTWGAILLKTGGSMLVSIALYSVLRGWAFAIGLVGLILVHELGHVLAMRH